MLLKALLYGNALFPLLSCVFFLFVLRESNLGKWEKLPRERVSGGILGFLALLAFIPDVEPMFPVERYLGLLIFLAVVLSVLCFLYIDHLFARSLAGILILGAHATLAETYAADLRFSSFFAAMTLLYGTAGIVLAAKPYFLRDLMRKCAASVWWRSGTVFLLGMWFLSALLVLSDLLSR